MFLDIRDIIRPWDIRDIIRPWISETSYFLGHDMSLETSYKTDTDIADIICPLYACVCM